MAIVTPTLGLRAVTVSDLIKRAYRLIGVYSIGETPSDDEMTDGINALNSLLDSLGTSKLLIYALTLDTISITAGTSSKTIGSTGDVASTRPAWIDPSTYLLVSGVSYPLTILDDQEYNGIGQKTSTSTIPNYLWYKADYPNGTLTFWPVFSAAATLKLWSWKALTGYSSLTDTLSVPPGYEEMLTFNLACNLAPEHDSEPSVFVQRKAANTMRAVKRANSKAPSMSLPAVVLPGPFRSHIESDT